MSAGYGFVWILVVLQDGLPETIHGLFDLLEVLKILALPLEHCRDFVRYNIAPPQLEPGPAVQP